jgi:hypothetical protein
MPPRSRRKDTDTTDTSDTLTTNEWAFVRYYAMADESHGSRALAAYRKAYPDAKGSEDTIRANGHKVLRRPHIASALAILEADRHRSQLVTRDYVLGRLMVVADHALEAGDYQATNRSLELLGKATGVFDTRADEQALGILDAIRKLSQSQGNVTVEAGYRELPPHREATEAGNGRQGQLRVTGDR